MEHEMKTVCAWCGKHLRGPEQAERVSHGICVPCRDLVEADARTLLAAPDDARVYEQWVDLGGEG